MFFVSWDEIFFYMSLVPMKSFAALYCSIRWIHSLNLILCHIPGLSAASTYNTLQIQSSPSPVLQWQQPSLPGSNASGLWILQMVSRVVAWFQGTGIHQAFTFQNLAAQVRGKHRADTMPSNILVWLCSTGLAESGLLPQTPWRRSNQYILKPRCWLSWTGHL